MAALEDADEDEVGKPSDRSSYHIVIQREVKRSELIAHSERASGCCSQRHRTSPRDHDSPMACSVFRTLAGSPPRTQDSEIEYTLQLGYHGDVPSMNAMQLMSSSIDHPYASRCILSQTRVDGRYAVESQITRSTPGTMSRILCSCMSHVKLLGKKKTLHL